MPGCCCGGGGDGEQRGQLKRQTTVAQEEHFRIEMEQLFSQHGNQGVMLDELQQQLETSGLISEIPRGKMKKMLKRADADKNSFITYAEFMNMYDNSGDLSKTEKTAMRRFVGAAITNIVPRYMREDFLSNYTCKPPPVFIFVISIIEIAVFVFYVFYLRDRGVATTAFEGVPPNSPLTYVPDRRHEAWRFLSYMFLHQGYVHLVSNLLFQILLGLPLEIVHKWWRVALIYMAGVIGGVLAHSVTDHGVRLVGASGGCYAIIGAHLAAVTVNWKEMNYKCSDCENPVRVLASAYMRLVLIFMMVFLDMGFAVYRRFYDPSGDKTGIAAHVGGLVAGLLVGVPILKNINELQWEKKVGRVTVAVFLAAIIFCVVFNCVYKGYPETDFSPCC